jgi:hypothetical protein
MTWKGHDALHRLTSIGGGADEVMLTVLRKITGTPPGTKSG